MNPQDCIPELLELAAKSPCSRDKRGAIVVRDGEILGRGFNAPVGGACSDDVCRKEILTNNFLQYSNTRSCGGHVEHAEAMAMRRAVCRLAILLAHSECDGRTVEESAVFENVAYERPLNGCELIHLNTSPSLENAKERKRAFGRGQWDRLKGEIARPMPATRGIAKPSRRRGCPSCGVLASSFGVSAIWLLHDEGWERWPMAEYAALAGVV